MEVGPARLQHKQPIATQKWGTGLSSHWQEIYWKFWEKKHSLWVLQTWLNFSNMLKNSKNICFYPVSKPKQFSVVKTSQNNYFPSLTWGILDFSLKGLSAQPARRPWVIPPRSLIMTLWGSLNLLSTGSTGLLTKHFQDWWIIATAGPWWGAVLKIHWKSDQFVLTLLLQPASAIIPW